MSYQTRLGILAILSGSFVLSSCFNEKKKVKIDRSEKIVAKDVAAGDLTSIATRRGLNENDLLAAVETYVPTGGRDDFVGFFGTGSGGKAAVFAIPSMRVLKYVGVFTPEPWQGFAYDDESKAMLQEAGRGELRYDFGDMGRPAMSMAKGMIDGLYAFFADGANGRIALVDLEDYETKTVLVNRHFQTSRPALSSTENTEYVVQTADAPEYHGDSAKFPKGEALGKEMRGGLTFWRVRGINPESKTEGHASLSEQGSFSVELPPYLQTDVHAGRGPAANLAFIIASCADASLKLGKSEHCSEATAPATLQIVDWRKAAEIAQQQESKSASPLLRLSELNTKGALFQWRLPSGVDSLQLSPDGKELLMTSGLSSKIYLVDTSRLGSPGSTASADSFGVLTGDLDALKTISVGPGRVTGMAFGKPGFIYVTATSPGRLVRIDTGEGKITATLELGFDPSTLFLPNEKDMSPSAKYAVVTNPRPHGRLTSVGPNLAMNPELIDISGDKMKVLYDMALPQANGLGGVAWDATVGAQIIRYLLGTDTRTGNMSPYKTLAGQEKVIREGNHVHVFGTLIRSHITPEIIEVAEGETVSIHLTNLEQAQDQTHGFTVDTYNVHGSWEPGKAATVTFVADRPGVFPYYCTEFCSALHLEMEGYLLVKPKGWKPPKEVGEAEPTGDGAEEKLAYENKLQTVKDTASVIEDVVAWLKIHNYENDERAVALVRDVQAQLAQAGDIQARIDTAVKDQNWGSAHLWTEQYFQYQVKAADAGLKAKKILTVAEESKRGESKQ
jgi:nitrous-oxide reductase